MRTVILCAVALQLSGCLPLVAVATVGAGAGTGLIHSQMKENPDGSSPTTYVSPEERARRQAEQAEGAEGAMASAPASRPSPEDAYDPNRSVYSQPNYGAPNGSAAIQPAQTYPDASYPGPDSSYPGQAGEPVYDHGRATVAQPMDQGQAAYGATSNTVGDPLPLRPPATTAPRPTSSGGIEVQPLD